MLQLEQEQLDGAALIQSLAQQNAQVIQAVEDLRQHNRRLTLAPPSWHAPVRGCWYGRSSSKVNGLRAQPRFR